MTPVRRRSRAGAALVLAAALCAAALGSAPAAAADTGPRGFDDEPLGSPPAACTAVGDVTVAAAEFGGSAAGNRAVRLSDQSSTVHTRFTCDGTAAAQKSVAFRLSLEQHDVALLVALGGAGASANGAWRFSLAPAAGSQILVRAYDGAAWHTVGHVNAAATAGAWTDVRLTATTSRAELAIAGAVIDTDVRASTATSLDDVTIGSSGTAPVGVVAYVDDLEVDGAVPTGAFAARTFAGEPTGAEPAGCTVVGDVQVTSATVGGRTGNAVRLNDQSESVHTRMTCGNAAAPEKTISFRYSVAQLDAGLVVAVLGGASTAPNGVWRLSLRALDAGGISVRAYDGSAWHQVGAVARPTSAWGTVRIAATTTAAQLEFDGTVLRTSVRAATATSLGGLLIGSSGTAPVGTNVLIDDLAFRTSLPASATTATRVEVIAPGGASVGQVLTDLPVARFQPAAGLTPADYTAEVVWGVGATGAATLSAPDAEGYVTISGSHTYSATGSAAIGATVTGPDGVPVTATREIFITPEDQVLIATSAPPNEIRFPDAVTLQNGNILVAYHEAAEHGAADGVIKVTESSDGGHTWSPPRVAVDIAYDARDPKLVALSDGTVILSYFVTQWTPSHAAHGPFTVRSTDHGATWSAPAAVDTQMSCSCGPSNGSRPTGAAFTHGPIVELANGDLLIPLYGDLPTDPRSRATVVRSTDGGLTWDAANESTIAVGTIAYQEPNLTVLPSGEIVALIRTTSSPVRAYLSRSFDDGQTWTTAVATDIPAQSHHQLLTSDGRVLLTYGDITRPNRPTSGIMIDDPSGSWDGLAATSTPIYDAGNSDQGNPSSVEIAPGEYLTLGYDVVAASLYGIFTTDADY
ncbi:sialidase family protein [Agromyces silvae]|uniref:sialidase family protein n=1 Tax=Agromyces silvae TaxID=3388266 RepID=UPI00280BD09A|nr:sialidase family protein [Agromyces protaetiae]